MHKPSPLPSSSSRKQSVPQLQVTLNTRQHVMANIGLRVPLTNASERETELVLYVLWDWFDGGLLDGW